MPAGFQSINDHGTIQIDQDHVSLVLRASGTATANSTWDSNYSLQCVSIPYYNGSTPIFAFKILSSTGHFGALMETTKSGTTYNFMIVTSGTVTFNYYVFDKPVAASSSGYGLQVFDATGALTYDSSLAPMKLVASAGSSGRSYAAAFSTGVTIQSFEVDETPEDTLDQPVTYWVAKAWLAHTVADGLDYSEEIVGSGSGPPPQPWGGGSQSIMIDVTNL